MKNYIKANSYDREFVENHIMGPNPLCLLETVCEHLNLTPDMRILDLGCGMGITSIFLAKEYGAAVYATDLWINPTENFKRIQKFNLEDKVIPIYADANALPYPEDYFDAVIAIDSYNYFGLNDKYFPNTLNKHLKDNAQIGLAFAGLSREIDEFPKQFEGILKQDDLDTFTTLDNWKRIFAKSGLTKIKASDEFEDSKELWYEWAKIARDRLGFDDDKMLDADVDNLFTLMYLVMEKL